MADKPGKPADKPAGKGIPSNSQATEEIVTVLVVLIVVGALITALTNYVNSLALGQYGGTLDMIREYFLLHIWPLWKVIAFFVSTAAVVGITYNMTQLNNITEEEKKVLYPRGDAVTRVASGASVENIKKNEKWENILTLVNSDNPSDWKLSIIEADVMLDELLRVFGYFGDTIGDMLKSVEKGDFISLDDAWEAHKVRNDIAHAGSNFEFNQREAKRVISLYEKVFKEFEIV